MTDTTVTWLTQEAYDKLQAELAHLSGEGRTAIAERIAAARDEGDLKENGGYHAAREEQAKNEARIRQLRQLLETLRTPDGDTAPDTAPTTHGLTSIRSLVDDATAAGLPTTFTAVGAPACDPPPLVQVNLYRIAQEALTNARRHAGPDATADVRLRFETDAVELEISNTGRRGSSTPGLGQLGMRERAAVSGGSIEIGPRSRGGYLVRVRVPLTPAEVANV